jgi:hypothetical protein
MWNWFCFVSVDSAQKENFSLLVDSAAIKLICFKENSQDVQKNKNKKRSITQVHSVKLLLSLQ